MASYDIDCVTCGGPHVVARKDGKYCPSCMLLKQLEYLRGKHKRERRCRTCTRKFRPAKQLDLAYCGDCETRQRGDTTPAPCRLKDCENPAHRNAPLGICRPCLKDPVSQDRIVVMLRTGQRKRKAAHGDKIASAPNLRRTA